MIALEESVSGVNERWWALFCESLLEPDFKTPRPQDRVIPNTNIQCNQDTQPARHNQRQSGSPHKKPTDKQF